MESVHHDAEKNSFRSYPDTAVFPACPSGQGGGIVPSEWDNKISYCIEPCRNCQGPHSVSLEYTYRKVSETCDLGEDDSYSGTQVLHFYNKEIGIIEISVYFKEKILRTYRLWNREMQILFIYFLLGSGVTLSKPIISLSILIYKLDITNSLTKRA